MIDDVLLRWIVTALFAVGAIDSIRTLAARRTELRLSITHCLMLLMSLAMIVMAWPQGNQLPLLPLQLLFALGTVTAVVFAMRGTDDRLLHVYTAVMMASMVWMYAVMGWHTATSAAPATATPAHHGSPPGTDALSDMAQMHGASSNPMWMGSVTLLLVLGFLALTIYCAARSVQLPRTAAPAPPMSNAVTTLRRPRLRSPWICHALTAGGTGIMFAALL
ncbi:DUF5134 domain-containing protein [Gordonia westfalica]|uniref:DUF5134 domain-containing protein n=1 Tax=Gordonia westfalica TaxID=158898 RepID=A0A1H2EAW2_9ACTN|nr:DUF5134 domain-containing protein [Gordonia westfalica]SDT92153.1 hypothetical protein SAMN04488548_13025 [Gordonia westfalica]